MKHLFILIAIFITTHLFAAPMATVEWVKEYIAKVSKEETGIASPVRESPEALDKTFVSTVKTGDGVEYEVSLSLKTTTRLALIVCDSTVGGVTNGTTYYYNDSLSAFEGDSETMPTIRQSTFYAATVTTNLTGVTLVTSNAVTHYSATTDSGVQYRSAKWYGRDYLISGNGFGGPKIGFVVSTVASNPSSRFTAQTFRLLTAYADEFGEAGGMGVKHYCGNLSIGTITVKRKGKEQFCTVNGNWQFNAGVGTGTVAEYTLAAFEDWYAEPKKGIFQSRQDAIAALSCNADAWGLPTGDTVINDDNNFVNFYWSSVYDSAAFQNALDAAMHWINSEYNRIFLNLYNALKDHTCPALKPDMEVWTCELNCRCQHTFPDINTGNETKCANADTPQHLWESFKLTNGSLKLSDDGIGCTLCARCLQHKEEEGAVHAAVPESAEYCGCYCGYYYEKKEEEPPTRPPLEPPPTVDEEIEVEDGIYEDSDVIVMVPDAKEEEIEIECTDKDGEKDTLVVPIEKVEYRESTNVLNGAYVPWHHVRVITHGANGKLISVIRSAKGLMDGENARRMHKPPTSPNRCTCACKVHHWFKKSPCPRICRGCGMADVCFSDNPSGGSQIWAGLVNGTNLTANVREYHTKMSEGYWADETYISTDQDGNEVRNTWSNKAGDETYPSKFSQWYYDTTTGGIAACGCACGRFYTDAVGNHGKPAKDSDGNVVDGGYHNDFHIYGLRPATDIKCPFTAEYYAGKNEYFPSCRCNNKDWEERNTPVDVGESPVLDLGWPGSMNRGGEAGSLACNDVCRWCWPYSHGISDEPELDDDYHDGIMRYTSMTGSVAEAYIAWAERNNVQCGCLCQAVTELTCKQDDGSDSGTAYTFPVTWDELGVPDYHLVNITETCICSCGKYHQAVNPKRWKEIMGDAPAPWQWSKCAEQEDICQQCGYTTQSDWTNNIVRARPMEHVYVHGCKCDCSDDDQAARFTPSEGDYSTPVRGWSAMTDKDNYPNNTRSGSKGYQRGVDDRLKLYHQNNRNGCLCGCSYFVGYELYHNHLKGEACKNVCKAYVGESQCGHAPDYYVHDAKSEQYRDLMGEHTRLNDDAGYCGCDCGGKTTQTAADGSETAWHKCAPGECYCYGHYAAGSTDDHNGGEPVLVKHIGLAATGNIVTNEKSCASCSTPYEQYANEFKCANDHIVLGDFIGGKNCNHRGGCARNCDCCDHNEMICECPWCNRVVGAVDYCTCAGRKPITDNGALILVPRILTLDAVVEIMLKIDRNNLTVIDGNNVLSIWDDGFEQQNLFSHCPNLKSVSFNNITTVGMGAFSIGFNHCPNLETVSFNKVESIYGSAFSGAFYGNKPLHLNFPRCIDIGSSAFDSCHSIVTFELPVCQSISAYAFADCQSLTRINIPKCTYLGEDVFFQCMSLSEVTLKAMSTNDYNCAINPAGFPNGCKVTFSDGVITF